MPGIHEYEVGTRHFLMGNEAIARGVLEAGVQFAAGYPGTPSSEIIQRLSESARDLNLHVEWSTNEKAATEGAGAAAFAGLRSLSTMKNAGLSVALDFLTHLSYTGLGDGGGAMVTVVCDDPEGHSSGDETDSRWLAKFASIPLIEASTVEEARDMIRWAYDLSEEFKCNIMFRGYTRLCHESSTIEMKPLSPFNRIAESGHSVSINPYLARPHHAALIEKLLKIKERFESSPFNIYEGPERPHVMIVSGGSGLPCSIEAVKNLGLERSVGILKLGTLWPFPTNTVEKHLVRADHILVAEEVDPYIEDHLKEVLADAHFESKAVNGRRSGHIPGYGEITPDRVMSALSTILGVKYSPRTDTYRNRLAEIGEPLLRSRGLTWCAGCPHRASFWALEKAVKTDKRKPYVTGDIGCYTLDVFPEGKGQMNLLHAMGSGTGLGVGFGQLGRFGYKQPVIAICGDSTFFHASLPALINGAYHRSHMIQIILDNSVTAMTGFQSHPGTGLNTMGESAPKIQLEKICRSLGAQVTVSDPFDVKGTVKIMRKLLKEDDGLHVLILRRRCEIVRMRSEKLKPFDISIQEEACKGAECGICSGAFRCPALYQDIETGKSRIKEDTCSGCGVCREICPFHAIQREDRSR